MATIGRATNESRKTTTATGDTDQVSYTHGALITLRANGFFSATVPAATVLEERSHSAMVSHTFAVRGGNIRLKNRPRLARLRLHCSLVYGEHGFSGALTVVGRIVLAAVLGAIRTGNVDGAGDSDSLTTLWLPEVKQEEAENSGREALSWRGVELPNCRKQTRGSLPASGSSLHTDHRLVLGAAVVRSLRTHDTLMSTCAGSSWRDRGRGPRGRYRMRRRRWRTARMTDIRTLPKTFSKLSRTSKKFTCFVDTRRTLA